MNIGDLLNLTPKYVPYVRRHRWSASGLGKCHRIQLLEAHGIKLKHPPERLRIFEIGNRIHSLIQEMIVEKYPHALIEYEISDEDRNIGGRIDVLIPDVETPTIEDNDESISE